MAYDVVKILARYFPFAVAEVVSFSDLVKISVEQNSAVVKLRIVLRIPLVRNFLEVF